MKSEGVCKFCGKTISGIAMERHLKVCLKRAKSNAGEEPQGKIFLLKASAGPFWVFFEVNALSMLENVDSFLRGLWLECCGHLSMFVINKVDYVSSPEEDDKSMDIILENAVKPCSKFIHQYDFGTTTQLDMKRVSERRGKAKKEIEILARNNMPDFKCVKCGKPAKEICTQCTYEGEGLLCKSCAKKHGCGEDMLLPLVNSPRTGMCGYTGQ